MRNPYTAMKNIGKNKMTSKNEKFRYGAMGKQNTDRYNDGYSQRDDDYSKLVNDRDYISKGINPKTGKRMTTNYERSEAKALLKNREEAYAAGVSFKEGKTYDDRTPTQKAYGRDDEYDADALKRAAADRRKARVESATKDI